MIYLKQLGSLLAEIDAGREELKMYELTETIVTVAFYVFAGIALITAIIRIIKNKKK